MTDDETLGRAFAGDGCDHRPVGTLRVRSGGVAAGDPLTEPNRPAFTVAVPVGDHPVVLIDVGEGNEGAMLVFGKTTPVRWELAVLPGQDVSDLGPGQFFGYASDTALGAFIDAAAGPLWAEEIDAYDDVPDFVDDEAFDEEGCVSHLIGSSVSDVDNPEGYNIVVFRSGYGDGTYATYIGIDEDGEPICLVTDFALDQLGP